MRAIGVVLCAVAACYSPSYVDCQITCTAGSCPSGFVCDQGVCRTPGFQQPCGVTMADASTTDGSTADGPPGDVDNDGIPNADDNCPNRSNTNQANEDGDTFGDVCDPCPPFSAAADNMDSDQDGVGDSCDPSPTTSGNSIAVFAGFAESTVPAGAMFGGDWTFGNGSANVTNTTGTVYFLYWQQPTGQGGTVMSRFTVNQLGQAPNGMGVVSQLDINTAPFAAIGCWVVTDTAGSENLTLNHVNGTDLYQTTPDALDIGKTYRPTLGRRSNNYSCTEPLANMNLSGNSAYTSSDPKIGLISLGVTARIEWVLIVSGI